MMLHFLDQLHALFPKAGPKDALMKALNQYISDNFQIIHQAKHSKDSFSNDNKEIVEWLNGVDSDEFYLAVARSAQKEGVIKLDGLGLHGRHSLTIRDMTWLILEHAQFGHCAVLQRNFSFEAIFFPGRKLYVIRRLGRLQVESLVKLFFMLVTKRSGVKAYLALRPEFGGLNLLFPSPLHCIFFGHTALYRIQTSGLYLRTPGYNDPRNVWFSAKNLFPLTVSGFADHKAPNGILEIDQNPPTWMFKAGHNYRRDQSDLNKALDTVLLASAHRDQTDHLEGSFRIWFGLSSGKRTLVNEVMVATAILDILYQQHSSLTILIDGWTSSSLANYTMEAPTLYNEHDAEVASIRQFVSERYQGSRVMSLVGLSYEQKVAHALTCSFFFCGSLSSSIVPDRICGLPGIVHISNAGRPHAQMHTRRRSITVPKELIHDCNNQTGVRDPLSTPYSIKIPEFTDWFKSIASDKLKFKIVDSSASLNSGSSMSIQ